MEVVQHFISYFIFNIFILLQVWLPVIRVQYIFDNGLDRHTCIIILQFLSYYSAKYKILHSEHIYFSYFWIFEKITYFWSGSQGGTQYARTIVYSLIAL